MHKLLCFPSAYTLPFSHSVSLLVSLYHTLVHRRWLTLYPQSIFTCTDILVCWWCPLLTFWCQPKQKFVDHTEWVCFYCYCGGRILLNCFMSAGLPQRTTSTLWAVRSLLIPECGKRSKHLPSCVSRRLCLLHNTSLACAVVVGHRNVSFYTKVEGCI